MYRRLNQLVRAGYINRRRMLWNGEYYYYLGKKGAELLKADGIYVPARATKPIGDALQRHEYEVARFWLKFWQDCENANLPIFSFWRDGELAFASRQVKPDGTILVSIGKTPVIFFLELDRSTQSSCGTKGNLQSFRGKMERYLKARQTILKHPEIASHSVTKFRILVACQTSERMEHLMKATQLSGMNHLALFTFQEQWINSHSFTSRGWRYRNCNFLTEELFAFPGRSPPKGLVQS